MEKDSIAINQKTYSLLEVMQSVQSVISKAYSDRRFWIRCELARISLHGQSGHCYLELIEKNETSIVAQLKGIIWSDKYTLISEKFRAVTNTPLSNGMKVMFSCSVNFHPSHGLSLTIYDVEPSFTLGEMARTKSAAIARLKSDGIYNQNRSRKMPLLPYRIAVVSVATSRGYHDFISTLNSHHRRYAIFCTLFDAVLQGDNAVPSLTSAINKIISQKDKFDAIAIIRGGAGDAGLACYDEYSLAALIAQSPLPLITGIGHATNETVAEMVAFKNCITPTAAATFLLEKFDRQSQILSEQITSLNEASKSFISDEKSILSKQSERFCLITTNKMNLFDFRLKNLHAGLTPYTRQFFIIKRNKLNNEIQYLYSIKKYGRHQILIDNLSRKLDEINTAINNNLQSQKIKLSDQHVKLSAISLQLKSRIELLSHLEEKTILLDPVNTLKRGYSITRVNGRAITDTNQVTPKIKLETQLANGVVISTVENN